MATGKFWESMGEYGRRAKRHTIYCRNADACLTRDRIGKYWEGLGRIGKRAKPAAAGRRAVFASYTLGNAHYPHTIAPAQRPQPPRTISQQLAAMHPKTPNSSQTFPILPTKAATNHTARVCGVQRHPPTPEAAEDKSAATPTIATVGGTILPRYFPLFTVIFRSAATHTIARVCGA